MTVIVGILCDGGVALAADRQSTHSAFVPLARPSLVQVSTSPVTKVIAIGSDLLLGTSGSPAIGNQYEALIKGHCANFPKRPYEFATRKLRDQIKEDITKNCAPAKQLAEVIGSATAYSQCTCECLMAANFKDGIRLIQIQQLGAFDISSQVSPLRVIGSGQFQADPFVRFLKNTFWPNRLPTVDEGVLAATWAVEYAIENGAPGVGFGTNAYSLKKAGGKVRAEEVGEDQLKGHRDFIRAARERLRELSDLRHATPSDAGQVPTMPNGK